MSLHTRRNSTFSSQTIEENAILDTSGQRLHNFSYKQSLKSAVTDNAEEDLAVLKPTDSDSDTEIEGGDKDLQSQSIAVEPEEVAQEGATENMPLQMQANTLVRPKSPMLKREDWQGKNQSHKLDTIFDSINKLYTVCDQVAQRIHPLEVAVFDKNDGILPQLKSLVDYAKDSDARVDSIAKQNLQLREELEIVKGVIHKQAKQITALQGKQAHQTARSNV